MQHDQADSVLSASSAERPARGRPGRLHRVWSRADAWARRYAAHPDPLAEASNWVALLIGTHLPFWPLYVLWCAGTQALPTALLTMTLTPVFLVIPLLARWNGLLGRGATVAAGLANVVFDVWILGQNSGTALFLAPCAALAAVLFRRHERWLMLSFAGLAIAVGYVLQDHAPEPLHHYDPAAARELFLLNAISIGVLLAAFGWVQGDIYRRMETG